jgi:hypothetical protein
MVIVDVAPFAIVPTEQTTVGSPVQTPAGSEETYVSPSGRTSVMTTSVASAGPRSSPQWKVISWPREYGAD